MKCRSVLNESLCHLYVICDVACQNQAFVTVMSYDIIGKECNFSFHMMYYLCF